MKKWFGEHFHTYMTRPIIYQVFTRCIYTLTIILIWDKLVNPVTLRIPLSQPLRIAAFIYLVLCWMAYLRMDGVKVPTFDRKLFLRKKHPDRFVGGDMADYIDEKVVSFEELEPEEKDLCLIVSNFFTAMIFLIAGLLF